MNLFDEDGNCVFCGEYPYRAVDIGVCIVHEYNPSCCKEMIVAYRKELEETGVQDMLDELTYNRPNTN